MSHLHHTTKRSDTDHALHVIPDSLMKLHKFTYNTAAVRELAREAVDELADVLEGTDAEFDACVPRALMLLAILDHMTERRTCGMIADYLDF
jgi:hypothetical protein